MRKRLRPLALQASAAERAAKLGEEVKRLQASIAALDLASLGERRSGAERRDRSQKALERVGMGHRAKHLPSQLSGGQQQRVAVARALVGEPSILLADEPTGNLDSRNGDAVMELMRDLHRNGSTICMVTHDPRFARHADRTIHLFDGRVVDENVEAAAGAGVA